MSEVKPVSNIPLSESKRKRRKIRKEFALGTSCHGLSQIYSSFSNVLRFLWILLILTVFAFLIWQVADRFKAYFLFETRLQVSEDFVNNLAMPAITICNANRYFWLTDRERQALNNISFIYDNGPFLTAEDIEVTEEFFEQQGEDFNLTNYLVSKSWQFDNETIRFCNVGTNFDCSESNFSSSFSTSSGQCWTLNTNEIQQKRGIYQGFHILLDVFQSGYSENPYEKASAGILFQVHPHYEPPSVTDMGQSVGVGLWGTVAMHKQEITNMYKPWGNCESSNEKLEKYSKYTVAACMKECFDGFVIGNCSCRDPSITRFPEIRECSPNEVIECAAPGRSLLEAIISPADCDCTQACSETKYSTSISYSTFPSQIAAREIGSEHNITLEFFRENYVGLTFYFDDLSITKMVESKAISISALLSDVGGQLGLWLGISVITLFEFMQFSVRMFQTIHWRKR